MEPLTDISRPLPPVAETVFLGVPISRLDAAEAAALIAARGPGAPFAYAVTPNASHFNLLGEIRDARFQDVYDHAWLRLMDGKVPRAFARNVFGLDLPHCAGSDLTEILFRDHIRPDDAITVIGGGEALRRRWWSGSASRGWRSMIRPWGSWNSPARRRPASPSCSSIRRATSSSASAPRAGNIWRGWCSRRAPWARACVSAAPSTSSPAS